MNSALREALEYYKKQVTLAEDRIRLFESGQMSVHDVGPPQRDRTAQAISNERTLIEHFRKGIEIIEGSEKAV